jgi:hypothetical protein
MASPEPLSEGLLLFDRYQLEAPLGRPRTGHTWRARDQRLDMTVAIKVFDQHPQPSIVEQGVREHSDVTHPNLVRLYEFIGNAERCAVVTEHVEGRSLGTLLRNRINGCFEMQEIRKWTEQLLSCLSALHKKGRVHGDLNLENLLVTERNDLKVLDAGLREGRLTSRHADLAFGSPVCSSPQVLSGGAAQPADDLYAVGACVYELLTGRPVFSGGNIPMQIEAKQPALVNARRAELGVGGDPVPEEWETWIHECLAKERRDRPQSAEALIEIIKRSSGTTTRAVTAPAAPETSQAPLTATTLSAATAPVTYVSTPQGMAIPMMMAPQSQSSPWGKIILAAMAVGGGGLFYFGSWKPSREELKQMEMDFQKVRQTQNKATDDLGTLRELESVLNEFVARYAVVDIVYSERDDLLRSQAEERLDACAQKIKDVERALAEQLQKERDAKQTALKADFDKATEITNAPISARSKHMRWQALLDDYGDWDNPDSLQDNKMLADARKFADQFKLEQQKEKEQMQLYGQHLQLTIERAQGIQKNAALTPSLRWKAFNEAPKLPDKPQGEQEMDFTAQEAALQNLKQELDDGARKETPAEPHTLESLFASSSFAKASAEAKADLIRGAQRVLKAKGTLRIEQPDGQPGEATHRSIADFQINNGLLANGELNDMTLWLLGYEGGPLESTIKEKAKQQASSKPRKPYIPRCPPESIYEGVGGKIRLGKDQLFNRVNEAEYKKHLKYKAWQDKYGDL